MKPYLCTTAGCKKSFEKEEDFKHHQAVHSSMRFKCNMCDKTFNRLDNKYAHIRSKHLNPTIQSSVGFFKFNCSEPISRKVGRTIYHCHVEECSYSSHDKQQLDNHIRAKHNPKPGPKIYRCSGDGCTKKFDRKYRYDRHIKNCKYYICSQPRMVAILSAGKLILLP